jgi:hypothetical protein
LDVEPDGHLVADDDLRAFLGGAYAEVGPADRRRCREPDPLLALQPGLIEAEELDWRTENPMALCAGSMIQVPAGTS